MIRKNLNLDSIRHINFYAIFLLLLTFSPIIIIGLSISSPLNKKSFMIPMRDGIKLSTDVYFAPNSFGSPRPVILIRTPYDKTNTEILRIKDFLSQNYHVVVQDFRGTSTSEGKEDFLIFHKAYEDGVDTINWILNKSWCNGKIGSAGTSALAINQYFYAGMNPQGLVSQSLIHGTSDLYETLLFQGGALRESIFPNWIKTVAPDNHNYQLEQLLAHPIKDEFYSPISLSMSEGPGFQDVSVSAIHVAGWYDLAQQGTLEGYMGYDDLGLPTAQGKQFLIIGPSTHSSLGEGKQGELIFSTKSTNLSSIFNDWENLLFDNALLNKPIDWDANRVAYYMMGDVDDDFVNANDYRFAKDWPIPYVNQTWYLANNGLLINGNTEPNNSYFSYIYDPQKPVPTLGGANLYIPSGPYDQRPIENRPDVLLFESPAFKQPYEVVGHVWAHLYVKSNCTNTDFTVKITDVYPDGRSMLISDGIINAIRRNGFNSTAVDLNTVEYTEVNIDLWSTAYQFNVGHKIRIAISSSNYPRFAANPNTRQYISYNNSEVRIANNTILIGPDFPSHIILPCPK